MLIKNIIDEDFVNYKKPSMFIGTCLCNWKCCKEQNFDVSVCQNSSLANQKDISVSVDFLVDRYLCNPITRSVVIGGLEPFLQFEEIYDLIRLFRTHRNDDIVIYTGYYPNEIQSQITHLKEFKNIIIKYGRFIKGGKPKFDEVLGITLASDNQWGEVIS